MRIETMKLSLVLLVGLGLGCTDQNNSNSDGPQADTHSSLDASIDTGVRHDANLDSQTQVDPDVNPVAGDASSVRDVIAIDASPDTMVTASQDMSVQTRVRKSLVIALDGVRPDALKRANTPRLDQLIAGTWDPAYRGAYTPDAQNLDDAATVSGPNHAAIMTGALGAQHGVTGNHDVVAGNYANFPHYLSRLEASRPEAATAYLFTWGPDVFIPSDADYVKDGDDASNTDRAVSILQGEFEDASGDLETRWSRGADIDAIFLFLDDPDHAGHAAGFEASVPGYIEEIERADARIGAIMDALTQRPTWDDENWQVVITSDHGGYHTSHGGSSAPERTIPFLVVSRDVIQGRLPQNTRIFDTVPTVLDHLGLPIPAELTGRVRGPDAHPEAEMDLDRDLVGYYRFDGDLMDATGRGNDGAVGPESDVVPALIAEGGKFGGHLSISDEGGGAGASSYVTLGRSADYEFGDDDAFTVTLWFRSRGGQGGDPVIIGNKNWASGLNPGWLMLANEGANNSFGANYSDGQTRVDLEDVDYSDTDWWFLASVYNPDGLALMFCGDAQGRLRWMALDVSGVGSLTSPLPLQIGQDGTGSYSHNLAGDIDDLAIWRRALSFSEVEALYGDGQGAALATQR